MSQNYRSLIVATIPVILALMVEPIAGMIDTALIGHKSAVWLGALGLSVAIFNSFAWIFNFLVHTVTARVGQAMGRGQQQEIANDVRLALFVASTLGLLAAAVAWAMRDVLLTKFMGATPEVARLAYPYYDLRVVSLPLVLVVSAMTGILRGLQQITQAFVLVSITTLTNAGLSYVLIYHFDFGLAGAGWGTAVSFLVGVLWGGGYLWLYRQALGLDGHWRLHLGRLWEFGSDSINLFGRSAVLTSGYASMAAVAGHMGMLQVAAHQVAFQAWLLASFVVDGFGITGTAVGAKLLGEGKDGEWQVLARRLLQLGFLCGILFALVYWWGRHWIIGVFTSDARVIEELASFWWLIAFGQPIAALVYVYDGLYFGSRDFRFLRRRMVEGALLVFVPTILLAAFVWQHMLLVWSAMAGLALYRLITSALFLTQKRSTDEINGPQPLASH